jgi:hypothetical protein
MHQLFFPNGFEKTKVRWEKIKIKLAHNYCIPAILRLYSLISDDKRH